MSPRGTAYVHYPFLHDARSTGFVHQTNALGFIGNDVQRA